MIKLSLLIMLFLMLISCKEEFSATQGLSKNQENQIDTIIDPNSVDTEKLLQTLAEIKIHLIDDSDDEPLLSLKPGSKEYLMSTGFDLSSYVEETFKETVGELNLTPKGLKIGSPPPPSSPSSPRSSSSLSPRSDSPRPLSSDDSKVTSSDSDGSLSDGPESPRSHLPLRRSDAIRNEDFVAHIPLRRTVAMSPEDVKAAQESAIVEKPDFERARMARNNALASKENFLEIQGNFSDKGKITNFFKKQAKNIRNSEAGKFATFSEIPPPPVGKASINDLGQLYLGMAPYTKIDGTSSIANIGGQSGNRSVLSVQEDFEIIGINKPIKNTKGGDAYDSQPKEFAKGSGQHGQLSAPDYTKMSVTQIDVGVKWVQEQLALKNDVLIQCKSGKGRSTTIVIAFLMKEYGMSLSDAIAYVKKHRPEITVEDGRGYHYEGLREYEESLKNDKITI